MNILSTWEYHLIEQIILYIRKYNDIGWIGFFFIIYVLIAILIAKYTVNIFKGKLWIELMFPYKKLPKPKCKQYVGRFMRRMHKFEK